MGFIFYLHGFNTDRVAFLAQSFAVP